MSQTTVPVNRALVGAIALACLGAALTMTLLSVEEPLWIGAFTRVGLVMAAFWLALPGRDRSAAWANLSPVTFVGLLLAIFAAVRFPRAVIPIAVIIAVIGFFLRPRPPRRRRSAGSTQRETSAQ